MIIGCVTAELTPPGQPPPQQKPVPPTENERKVACETYSTNSSAAFAGIDGKHIWAETYDRAATAEAIFAVQDEITLAVIRNIYGKTFAGDQTYLFKTDNLKAWAEATKGRAAMIIFTPDGLKQARRHFEIALELDPNFASAVADIGMSHLMYMRMGYASDPNKSLALAESFVTRALEMDPSHRIALSRLATVRVIQKRSKEAQKLSFQAAEIAPSDFVAIATAAWVLKYTGELKRSLPFFTKAKRLQPVTPWWLIAD